jgi:hypothetical protein
LAAMISSRLQEALAEMAWMMPERGEERAVKRRPT